MTSAKPEIDYLQFIEKYPDVGSQDFYETLVRKREFSELALDPSEDIPANRGDLMKHQAYIKRLMSDHTLYSKLILFNDVGTGKTCSVVAAAETLRTPSSGRQKTAIILPGPRNIVAFRNSIAEVCTKGQYLPKLAANETVTKEGMNRRIINLVSRNYEFYTFLTLARTLNATSDEGVIRNWSNRLILIDEAHGIRDNATGKDKEQNRLVYSEFHRMLHLAQNSKIVLMTATPVVDTADEISGLFNLLLDENSQLPTGNGFIQQYMNTEKIGGRKYHSLIEDKKQEIKDMLRSSGILISRVRGIRAQSRLEQGHLDHTAFLPIVTTRMSPHQSRVWAEARKKDKSFMSVSRQASLWVYPDGTFGTKGFKENMRTIDRKDPVTKKIIRKGFPSFKPNTAREIFGKAETTTEIMAAVFKHSSVMGRMLVHILSDSNEVAFVHFEFVKGGAMIFANILQKLGYQKISGNGVVTKPGQRRFAILTGDDTNRTRMTNIFKTISQPANRYGDICQVLIGSEVTSQSFSIFNVRQVHDTSQWNDSTMEQTLGRAFRGIFSHQAFPTQEERYVKIFRHAGVPVNVPADEPLKLGTDVHIYQLVETKERGNRSVIQMMEEAAVDCHNNKRRNRPGFDQDGSKQCNFTDCELTCDGVPDDLDLTDLDEETYMLFYSDKVSQRIQDEVVQLFKRQPVWTFDNLLNHVNMHVGDVSHGQLAQSMLDLSNSPRETMSDFMGRPREIGEFNNWFVMSDAQRCERRTCSLGGSIDTWYDHNMTVTKPMQLSELIDKAKSSNTIRVFQRLISFIGNNQEANSYLPSLSQLESIMRAFNDQMRVGLLQWAISSVEMSNAAPNNMQRKLHEALTKIYSNNIVRHVAGRVILNMSGKKVTKKTHLRCMDISTGEWTDCNSTILNTIEESKSNRHQQLMSNNPFGVYATKLRPDLSIRYFAGEADPMNVKKPGGRTAKTQPWNVWASMLRRLSAVPDNWPIIDTSINIQAADEEQLRQFIFSKVSPSMSATGQRVLMTRSLEGAPVEEIRNVANWFARIPKKKNPNEPINRMTKPAIIPMLTDFLVQRNLVV